MKLMKCGNGHYYDGDQFFVCPHCKSGAEDVTIAGESIKPEADDLLSSVTVSGIEKSHAPQLDEFWRESPTEPIADDEDKTVALYGDNEKTVGYYFAEEKAEPVVGWLVCLQGQDFGKSFNLKSGRNFIGRNDTTNDIALKDDYSIAHEKHAIIIYDPKSRKFLAQPGMSRELFYVNDQVVLQVMPMNAKDVIQLGNTKLMFIPCCGEDFSWDDFADHTAAMRPVW